MKTKVIFQILYEKILRNPCGVFASSFGATSYSCKQLCLVRLLSSPLCGASVKADSLALINTNPVNESLRIA